MKAILVITGTAVLASATVGAPGTSGSPETTTVTTVQEPAPSTPREFFNAGTRKFQENKLKEAEALLEAALASQQERIQSPALFNLGHIRFAQGAEELKKGPPAGPTAERGRNATQLADEAIRDANESMAANDVQRMVRSYMAGRGARRELKAAALAVKKALEAHAKVLGKWDRASGDFKSALELNPADKDARENAEIVDRNIARLIDSIRELQQAAMAMGDKNQQLGEKLKHLRGMIPAPDAPPGAAGEEEDEEDFPFGPQPGQKEGPTKEGEEMSMSPEQAGWMLEGFKLDSERRLPMGEGDKQTDPKQRSGRTW